MSYGRNPYYIYSDGVELYLDGVRVNEEVINAFLYQVLLKCRRDELGKRLKSGKNSWLHKYSMNPEQDIEEIPQDAPEIVYEKEWMEQNEDNIIKDLMK